MSLTRAQVLAAALALAYADAAAVPPGGTIAQGAAAQQAAGVPHEGAAGPKKVATAPGSVKYHEPIGALIIPHYHPSGQGLHYVHGQPGHMIHPVSEPEWIANQWKDKDHASAAAEKAVAEGTHHWVQAGEHAYAVHNGLEVHVPKDVDLHDPAAVKNAVKAVVKPGDHPEHVMLHPDTGPGEAQHAKPGVQYLLEQHYKKLPGQPAKKAVAFGGKPAAWVPHDWQVYKAAGKPDAEITGKWAKDPQGTWHFIGKAGEEPAKAHEADEWVKSGALEPDEHPGPAPGHVAPNQAEPGHEPAKADIGGVAVTKEEIYSAIQHLEADKSTAVKQPLQKKGHPLAAMDYHAVAQAELAGHPELKVPKGTKKAHVGQVKIAVLHHLAAQAGKLAQDEAQAKAAEGAQALAGAAAAHAQQLTPGTYEIGGVHVTAGEIQDAIAKLSGSKSTQIKGLLKGNPLAGSDYWKVVSDYSAAHGTGPKVKGTKQAHVPAAKLAFIAALKEKAGQAATGEIQPGYDEAAAVDAAIASKYVKDGWQQSAIGAVVRTLFTAAGKGSTRYAYPGPEPGTWTGDSVLPPDGKAYYEVTPEHKVTLHFPDGSSLEWSQGQVAEAVEDWTAAEPPEPGAAEPAWEAKAWKQTPEYQAVHDLVWGYPPGLPPHDSKLDTGQQLAATLYLAAKTGTRYLVPGKDGGWEVHSTVPPGVAGTFGAPGKAYYEVSPDHQITYHGPGGQPVALPGEQVKQIAEKWLVPPGPEPGPAKSQPPAAPGPAKSQPPAAPGPAKSQPPAAPSPDIQQLKALLANGAVKPSGETEGGKQNTDWVLAVLLKEAAKHGTGKWAAKDAYGTWKIYGHEPYAPGAEYYHVTPDLAVTHHAAAGPAEALSPGKVAEIAHQLVIPDAVKLKDPYGPGFSIYKYGFYYKPSKSAKAYLEIAPWEPGQAYQGAAAKYVYHAPAGTKEVSDSYAAKVLSDATEYHAQAKGAPVPAAGKKAGYATVAKPGSYQLWSDVTKAPSPEHSAELLGDGSVLLNFPGGSTPLAGESQPEAGLLKGGSVLDSYGTSVVKPGVKPEKYHVFGSEAKTPEQVQHLLDQMEAAYGDKPALAALAKGLAPGKPQQLLAYKFLHDKNAAATWQGQRDAVMGLLRELLQVPEQPAGAAGTAPGVTFLKGLPPGILKPEDIFTWTDQGYARPAGVAWPEHDLAYATSAVLTGLIKQVSEQFGGGKVVGTHPSALAKDAKLGWLKAWQAGDMAKVFAYDASGGKVSPVHPGAPGNHATHHVTWAPWDPSQVPASQVIEGDWSAEGVLPPAAEVDNYLIKAGLQHAAWLTVKQRREWMQAHRQHDQLAVDKLSRQAADAFASGAQPKSEPPVFTENLAPAKPWDAYLDEQIPARYWPDSVQTAFRDSHQAELQPFAEQVALTGGYSGADFVLKYYAYRAIQAYLDDLAAREAAEKLKPRYHLASPGIAEDQFGRQYEWVTGTEAQVSRRAAVAQLARAWGFRTPQVTRVKLEDGTPGAVAPLLDHEGTLAFLPAGVSGLTNRELGDIAREHVLDYALANPWSTPGSYIRAGDGSVIGTGKAGALTGLGWAGTDPVQMNAYASQPVSLIFSAIAGGSLSREQADAAYAAAVRAARRMAALPDARMRQLLAGAPVTTAVTEQLIDRKNALPDQVQAMWDQAYASKGWAPPEVPAAKLTRGLHSGFSEPEFMDHVAAAKSFGVPAFFDEPGLAGGHVLVWTELDPAGQRLVRGEATVRGGVLDKVAGWVKAHSGEASSMVPKGDSEVHAAILKAAEVIHTHNAVVKDFYFGGPITAEAITGMSDAKARLQAMLADAQHAVTLGPASGAYQKVAQDHGDPGAVVSMAQYYLAQIDVAEHAKAAGQDLSPDQFPAWKPAGEAYVLAGGVKIAYKKARRDLGTNASEATEGTWLLGKEDGELHLAAGKSADYPGYAWEVSLPTGEVIEINDTEETQTPKAHAGMIRFTAVTADGSASLERVRAFLQQAGLPMEEATQAGMENLYWRTLAWVLSDRRDRKAPGHIKVWDEVAQALYGKDVAEVTGPGKPARYIGELPAQVISRNMPAEEEAQMWRKAWAHLTSPEQVQQWVDAEGYLPHLGHYDIRAPQVPGGKPDWYRFDVTPEQVAARQYVTESFYDPAVDAALIARSGGLYSSDARMRALGVYKTGMSWGTDMARGSSGTVFTRQNNESSLSAGAWISPRVLARVQTYAFPEDKFGEVDARRSHAWFDFAQSASHAGTDNEAMVMDAISLLDDIEMIRAHTEKQRQQIIDDLKAAGLTEIRGLPVEDRIVTASGVPAAVAKTRAAMQADGWFAQPENPFVPPPSALSGVPAAEKKFAQQAVTQEEAMDAQAGAAQVAQQLEEIAQGQEVPFSYAV